MLASLHSDRGHMVLCLENKWFTNNLWKLGDKISKEFMKTKHCHQAMEDNIEKPIQLEVNFVFSYH